jgi:hypothetical protein
VMELPNFGAELPPFGADLPNSGVELPPVMPDLPKTRKRDIEGLTRRLLFKV